MNILNNKNKRISIFKALALCLFRRRVAHRRIV